MTLHELKARESALINERYQVGKLIDENESQGISAYNAYAVYDEISAELEEIQMQIWELERH